MGSSRDRECLLPGRAIVATGSYGPKGFDTDFEVMIGAEQADGNDLIRVVRDQMGKGADVIKFMPIIAGVLTTKRDQHSP